jgi:hypothetical protein
LGSGFTHAHRTVNDAAFEHYDGLRVDIALDAGCPLNLDTLVGNDCSHDSSTDDDFMRADVAMYGPLAAEQELARSADCAFDSALDLHDACAFNIANDLHS